MLLKVTLEVILTD